MTKYGCPRCSSTHLRAYLRAWFRYDGTFPAEILYPPDVPSEETPIRCGECNWEGKDCELKVLY